MTSQCVQVYNKVSYYRKKFKLSQTELASLLGISKNSVSSIERYEFVPSLSVAFALAFVFNVKVDDLFVFNYHLDIDDLLA